MFQQAEQQKFFTHRVLALHGNILKCSCLWIQKTFNRNAKIFHLPRLGEGWKFHHTGIINMRWSRTHRKPAWKISSSILFYVSDKEFRNINRIWWFLWQPCLKGVRIAIMRLINCGKWCSGIYSWGWRDGCKAVGIILSAILMKQIQTDVSKDKSFRVKMILF